MQKSVSFFLGMAVVFRIKAEDNASPYSAEYPPVLNTVPLKSMGENLPRAGTLGSLAVNGLSTCIPSIKVLVSYCSPPRTSKTALFVGNTESGQRVYGAIYISHAATAGNHFKCTHYEGFFFITCFKLSCCYHNFSYLFVIFLKYYSEGNFFFTGFKRQFLVFCSQ